MQLVASMEQPTRVTVTRAVAAPRLNLLLEETGVVASFTIEVQIERAEPFTVERTGDDLVRFAAEIGKAYAGSTVQFDEFPLFKTSGEVDDAFLEVATALVQHWLDDSLRKLPTPAERVVFGRAMEVDLNTYSPPKRRATIAALAAELSEAGLSPPASPVKLRCAAASSAASPPEEPGGSSDADDARAVAALEAALRERLGAAADASERRAIEELLRTPRWLQCFVDANAGDAAAATRAVLAYASYAPVGIGPASEAAAAPRLTVGGAPMIELLRAPDGEGRPIGLVRDISRLSKLLSLHTFDEIASAHLWRLQTLLIGSEPGRRRGVTLVQDLSQLSLWLQLQVMEPRTMLAQARFVRYIFACFPIKWGTLVVIDAPSLFTPLWRALHEILPASIVEQVHFLQSPCRAELARLLGAAAAAEIRPRE